MPELKIMIGYQASCLNDSQQGGMFHSPNSDIITTFISNLTNYLCNFNYQTYQYMFYVFVHVYSVLMCLYISLLQHTYFILCIHKTYTWIVIMLFVWIVHMY